MFMLEIKFFIIKKLKKELFGVLSKWLDVYVKLFECCDFFCFYLCRYLKVIYWLLKWKKIIIVNIYLC